MIKNNLKVGDLIKCQNKDDAVDCMYDLERCGYETDFVYEHNGKSGIWLVITRINRRE